MGEDLANKERIAKLLRFASTHDDTHDQTVSLADYIGRMKEGQDKIYYVTADTFAAAKNSPHLEIFRKKGIEVLLLSDRVDEWVVGHLTEFDGKQLQSVAKGDLDLGKLEDEEEKKEPEKEADEFKELLDKIKDRARRQGQGSARHPPPDRFAGLPGGRRARHERQPGAHAQGRRADRSAAKPILEINPQHPVVQRLKYEESRFADWADLLFEQATLAEGGQLDDPAGFVKRINDLMMALSGK